MGNDVFETSFYISITFLFRVFFFENHEFKVITSPLSSGILWTSRSILSFEAGSIQ